MVRATSNTKAERLCKGGPNSTLSGHLDLGHKGVLLDVHEIIA